MKMRTAVIAVASVLVMGTAVPADAFTRGSGSVAGSAQTGNHDPNPYIPPDSTAPNLILVSRTNNGANFTIKVQLGTAAGDASVVTTSRTSTLSYAGSIATVLTNLGNGESIVISQRDTAGNVGTITVTR